MKKISVFDTTISDYNLGNQIIMDSINKELKDIFPNDFFFKLPFMEITRHTLDYLANSNLVFFGGTNSLCSKMEEYNQWGLNFANIWGVKGVILMGIGWWQYQDVKTSLYTKFILNRALSKSAIHSVRDNYTLSKLRQLGFKNVVNTGCPTIWGLTDKHCKKIPTKKSKKIVMTFTDYNQNILADKKLFSILKDNYKDIYYWVQGVNDYSYVINNFANELKIIPPFLEDYDNFLLNNDVDYVGTRLHAGIRALQFKKRSLIIGIDNRAMEMNKSFNLPVIEREDYINIAKYVISNSEIKINVPFNSINTWKKQFNN